MRCFDLCAPTIIKNPQSGDSTTGIISISHRALEKGITNLTIHQLFNDGPVEL